MVTNVDVLPSKNQARCEYCTHVTNTVDTLITTIPLDLNFTHTRVQKATAHNIHSNAPKQFAHDR